MFSHSPTETYETLSDHVGLLVAFFLGLTIAAPARAQLSNTTGLFLNAHLNGTSITVDLADLGDEGDETDTGGGLGLQVGYGFSRLVTVYLAANGSAMNDDDESYTLGHADLGVQLNFRSGRKAVPYANLAFSYREVSDDDDGTDITLSGGGLTLGGGLKYFLSPKLALDLNLLGTFGQFTDVKVGNVTVEDEFEVDASSFRFALGLSWFPMSN